MIVICAAMHDEVKELVEQLNLISDNPFPTYGGTINNKMITLVITGIGKTNASSGLTYTLSKLDHVSLIINIGIVGGHKVGINNVYLVNKAQYSDVDLTQFGYLKGQIPRFPSEFESMVIGDERFIKWNNMRLLTSDTFQTKIIDDMPYIADMEGTSYFQVACIFGIDIISIKMVSDIIASDDQILDYKEKEAFHSKELFKELLNVMEVL